MKDLAIAYAMKKKAKKMAEGGAIDSGKQKSDNEMGVHGESYNTSKGGQSMAGATNAHIANRSVIPSSIEHAKSFVKGEHKRVLREMKSMPKKFPAHFADGGKVSGDKLNRPLGNTPGKEMDKDLPGLKSTAGMSNMGAKVRYGDGAYTAKELAEINIKREAKRKKGYPDHFADGGFVEEEMDSGYVDHEEDDVKHNEAAMHEDDFIDRLIAKKMSEGGMVSNDVGVAEADKKPAEYDDLVLRDELEDHYTGKNSGDELGDAQEDEDRHDIVAKIMKSRAKKDKMPRPA